MMADRAQEGVQRREQGPKADLSLVSQRNKGL